MSEQSISLTPGSYDKLGVIHCGVISDFTVACAGDLHQLQDGEEYTFKRTQVTVKRNGDEVVFTKE